MHEIAFTLKVYTTDEPIVVLLPERRFSISLDLHPDTYVRDKLAGATEEQVRTIARAESLGRITHKIEDATAGLDDEVLPKIRASLAAGSDVKLVFSVGDGELKQVRVYGASETEEAKFRAAGFEADLIREKWADEIARAAIITFRGYVRYTIRDSFGLISDEEKAAARPR